MRKLVSLLLSLLIITAWATPVFAEHSENWRPTWSTDAHRILRDHCQVKAAGSSVGNWEFFYECPNGSSFWSDVLAPFSASSLPPTTYRPHDD